MLTTCTGKFRELQRLTVQYARILDLTLEDDSDGDDNSDDDEGEGRGEGNTDAMAIEA